MAAPGAARYDKAPAQVLLRWAVQQDVLVVPKSTNPVRASQMSSGAL